MTSRRSIYDDIACFHDYDMHIGTRTIYVGSQSYESGGESGTDFRMAERLYKNVHVLDSVSNEPIRIVMNNLGGDDYHMAAIYDTIRAAQSDVTVVGAGVVASAGAFIMQAADHRVLHANARFMIHYGSGSRHDREWEVLCNRYREVLHARMREKNPKVSKAHVHDLLLEDSWFSAHEAVALGFADEVL